MKQKDWRNSGESKQVHLELEQNEGVGPEVGSGGKSCWRRQAGWVPPVAAETQGRPAWSVADEDTTSGMEETLRDLESKNKQEEGDRGGGLSNDSLSTRPKHAEPQRIRKVGPARYG